MYHPWDDDKGARRGGGWLEVVYCPSGNDETDGPPASLSRPKERRTFCGKEGPAGLSRPRILDEVPPLSVQDKTHFCVGFSPSDFITREHTLPEIPLWDRPVRSCTTGP